MGRMNVNLIGNINHESENKIANIIAAQRSGLCVLVSVWD